MERAFKKQVLGMNSPHTLLSVPCGPAAAVAVVGSVSVSGDRNGSFVIVEVKSVRPEP